MEKSTWTYETIAVMLDIENYSCAANIRRQPDLSNNPEILQKNQLLLISKIIVYLNFLFTNIYKVHCIIFTIQQ